jgi:hypothetical protein
MAAAADWWECLLWLTQLRARNFHSHLVNSRGLKSFLSLTVTSVLWRGESRDAMLGTDDKEHAQDGNTIVNDGLRVGDGVM